MADDDTTLAEQILNIAKAKVEAEVEPHSVSDGFGREAIASIGRVVGTSSSDGHQAALYR